MSEFIHLEEVMEKLRSLEDMRPIPFMGDLLFLTELVKESLENGYITEALEEWAR